MSTSLFFLLKKIEHKKFKKPKLKKKLRKIIEKRKDEHKKKKKKRMIISTKKKNFNKNFNVSRAISSKNLAFHFPLCFLPNLGIEFWQV